MPTTTVAPEALLVLNPRTDLRFRDFARDSQHPDNDRGSLERRIRRRYPLTIVRARDAAAGQAMVWYVYRDGTWTAD